jgi:hypothetical protein
MENLHLGHEDDIINHASGRGKVHKYMKTHGSEGATEPGRGGPRPVGPGWSAQAGRPSPLRGSVGGAPPPPPPATRGRQSVRDAVRALCPRVVPPIASHCCPRHHREEGEDAGAAGRTERKGGVTAVVICPSSSCCAPSKRRRPPSLSKIPRRHWGGRGPNRLAGVRGEGAACLSHRHPGKGWICSSHRRSGNGPPAHRWGGRRSSSRWR